MNKIEYDKLRAERMLKFFLNDRSPRNCKILDVGCVGGELLMLLENEGFDCYGLDISNEALRVCSQKSNAQLLRGDACKLPFKDSSFDVICCMEVIEHLFNPHEAVREIKRVLKSEGSVYFSFPLQLNLEYRIRILLGKNIHDPLAVGGHIRFFKPKDVEKLLIINNGLKIIRKNYHAPGYKLAKYIPSIEKFFSNKLPSIFAENVMIKAIKYREQ